MKKNQKEILKLKFMNQKKKKKTSLDRPNNMMERTEGKNP